MKIKVLKFGGTSIAEETSRRIAALKVISVREQGYAPVVVVSALGRKGQPYATDTLLSILKAVDPSIEPEPREQDLMIACGEILASVLFAHTLKTLGYPAQSFRGGQAGIRTDGVYGNARIIGINSISLKRSLEEGNIVVVCGFQGLYVRGDGSPGGELTTLGRGGSDTTAAALGASLMAECVEIYTDVDGVKSANPSIVSEAETFKRMSYQEVAEMAHLGANVLHPRAAEISMQYSIPLYIKNTYSEHQGTEISGGQDEGIFGVTHTGQLIYYRFILTDLNENEKRKIKSGLFKLLSVHSFDLYMVQVEKERICFAIPKSQFAFLSKLLEGLVIHSKEERFILFNLGSKISDKVRTQALLFEEPFILKVDLTESCTLVSVIIRSTVLERALYYTKALQEFKETKIQVIQTNDSEFSISFLVPESEAEKSVKMLWNVFEIYKKR